MQTSLASSRALSSLSVYSQTFSRRHGTVRKIATSCLRTAQCRTQPKASSSKLDAISPSRKCRREFHSTARVASTPKDPYKTLGVSKDASLAEIKKSYYSLARKYHPDTNKEKDAQEKFVEIQAAYDTLSDESKRAAYDKYGAASQQPGFDPNAFANGGAGGFGAGGFGFADFGAAFRAGPNQAGENIFEQLFGASFGGPKGRRRSGATENYRGDDLEARIGISFMEAANGVKRAINITPIANCSTCSGSGLKPGIKRTTCTTCGGSGTRTFVIDNGFQMASTCGACQGTGTTVPRGGSCGDCGGMGKVRMRRLVNVDVPAGVEDGMTIRVPNEGDAPISGTGPRGDLLVRVNVAASRLFRRQGSNIHYDARIPMHTALLGGRVRVPTLDSDVDVRVPGGTQPGEEMVLKGRGMPSVYGGEKGDLFVSFAIQLPRTLTKRQRELLQMYADDVEGRTPQAKAGSETETKDGTAGTSSMADDRKGRSGSKQERKANASETSSNANGMDTEFNDTPHSSDRDVGWVTFAWQKLRRMAGL